MSEVVRTRRIARPVGEVWAVLADFGAISTWADDVEHSSLLTADPVAGGDRLGLARRVQLGRTTLVETVVRWDEPTDLAYGITGLPKVVRSLTNAWHLAPDGEGATAVTLRSTIDCGPRPPQRLVAALVGRKVGAGSDGLLAGLAAHLETSRA